MEKVKIYDFDKTLAEGDSIFYLIKYAKEKNIVNNFQLFGMLLRAGFKYLWGFRFENFKSYAVRLVDKFSDEELEKFVQKHLEVNGYKNLIDEIHEEGYITILCSASLARYIKIAAKKMGFDYYIGTDHNEKIIIGNNNAGKEKLVRLKKLFEEQNIEVDYENSKAYTDSYKNDKYMAQPCKHKFLVNSDKKIEGFTNIVGIK